MSRTCRLKESCCIIALCLSAAAAAPAATEAELDAAFDAMLADPGNIDLTLDFARVATEAGDYEAAIGALEGVLIMAPDNPVVRADLGILYYRLHSLEMARYHLRAALETGRAAPGILKRAENTLTRIDDSGGRHAFGGRISAGFRHRTNANSAPDTDTIRAGGLDVALRPDFQEEDDTDFFALSRASHIYDFGRQNRLAWETDAFLYVSRQFDLDDFDNFTSELTTGPRWQPSPAGLKGLTVRPHAVVNWVFLGDDLFSNVYGGGIDLQYVTDRRLRLSAIYQYRERDFHNSTERPFVEQERDGNENYFAIDGRFLLTERLSVYGRFDLIDREARADFNDALDLGITARADVTYRSPIAALPGRWRFYVGGGYRNIDYDDPNPRIDPLVAQDDDEYRFNVGNAFPITGRWQANLEVLARWRDSNLPNFENDNVSVAFSVTYWF